MTINLLWTLFVLIVLVIITFEDVKYRAIQWWLFPLVAIGFIGIEFKSFTSAEAFMNIVFLFIQVAILSLYFSFKEKKMIDITKKYIGWGDILFWIAACLLFSLSNYLFFFISSLIFSATVFLIWKKVAKYQKHSTIPLAGLQSFYILLLLILSLFSKEFSFRNENVLEKIILQ